MGWWAENGKKSQSHPNQTTSIEPTQWQWHWCWRSLDNGSFKIFLKTICNCCCFRSCCCHRDFRTSFFGCSKWKKLRFRFILMQTNLLNHCKVLMKNSRFFSQTIWIFWMKSSKWSNKFVFIKTKQKRKFFHFK